MSPEQQRPAHDDPALISYRLAKLEDAVIELVRGTQSLQSGFIGRESYQVRDTVIEKRFEALDERLDKISRSVLAFITSVAATVIAALILYFVIGGGGPS